MDRKMKWIWIGDPETEENHRYDYRWIKNKKERKKWIKDHWRIK